MSSTRDNSMFHFHPHEMPLNYKPKKVLILSKSSLIEHEFERSRNKYADIKDKKFLKDLSQQLTKEKVEEFVRRHDQQLEFIASITQTLKKHGIDYKVVQRREYSYNLVTASDLVISAGGDGTFLAAAKRIRDSSIPLIGINTDPIGSEGFLCLTGKARKPADEVMEQFLSNEFHWMYRQRIRVTIVQPSPSVSASSSSTSIGLVNNNCLSPAVLKNALENDIDAMDTDACTCTKDHETQTCEQKFRSSNSDDDLSYADDDVLHKLALNEVFVGESHAARVSYYDVQLDDGPLIKQKSSGMTICTGTGSTSWHYNINRLIEQTVYDIFETTKKQLKRNELTKNIGFELDRVLDSQFIEQICRLRNADLIFSPDEKRMAFSIRDPVFNDTFLKTASYGFVQKIRLKSRCSHAHLILDGTTSIPFNRGAEVLLEIFPQDAIRTAVLNSS